MISSKKASDFLELIRSSILCLDNNLLAINKPVDNILIRSALNSDHKTLTAISFSSKEYWKYPSEYLDIWSNELTITEDYISKNFVYVVESGNSPIAYYSVVFLEKPIEISDVEISNGYWLEHMFVLPRFIGNTVGSRMISHIKDLCEKQQITVLKVLADPNSKVFYEKIGFEYLRDIPSTIPNRTTPELILKI